jgi:hypothetical protein
VPAAIAIASEETAMMVSFQCFLRMRSENRILGENAMFVSISKANQDCESEFLVTAIRANSRVQ